MATRNIKCWQLRPKSKWPLKKGGATGRFDDVEEQGKKNRGDPSFSPHPQSARSRDAKSRSFSMRTASGGALTSAGLPDEAPPAFAAPGEDDDDGGAPALLPLLPLPLLPPPAAAEFVVARAEAARAEAARLPPSPPPPDDVAATMAAQGLAATGAAGCSSGISRKRQKGKTEKKGFAKEKSTTFRSRVPHRKERNPLPFCVSPFPASVFSKALRLCRKLTPSERTESEGKKSTRESATRRNSFFFSNRE